jgi:hypothetical protein
LHYVKHFTKFVKIVRDYLSAFRHLRQVARGDTRPSVLDAGKHAFFVGQGTLRSAREPSSYQDRLDRSGAFKPSCRWGISLSIGRGTIVDSGGDLGVRLLEFVGNGVGNVLFAKIKRA